MADKMLMEKKWEQIQKKAFTKWFNSYLMKRGQAVEDIQMDLKDGLKLINFLEIISNKSIVAKYEKKPKMRIQMIGNVGVALSFLASEKVQLISIGAEDIVDCNQKLILGMIWTIIQKYQIQDISEEELSAKEALLLWAKKKTAGYRDVKVENFHNSWQDGLAFCALIHRHRPDLLNYDDLKKENPKENLKLAFEVAEKQLGIPALLDVDDIVDVIRPDEKSIMTYVSLYYHAFASSKKQEIAGRRIGRLVDLTNQVDNMKNDYEGRAKNLKDWMHDRNGEFSSKDLPTSIEGCRQALAALQEYRQGPKPEKSAEKVALETLFNSINLKLKANDRSPYVAPQGLGTGELNEDWEKMNHAEKEREEALRRELERQEKLKMLNDKFQARMNKLEQWVSGKEKYMNKDEVVDSVKSAKEKIKVHDAFYDEFEQSKGRLNELNDILKQLENLQDPNSSSNKQKLDSLTGRHSNLIPAADKKKEDLLNKLKIQEKMDQMRFEFARLASEYSRFIQATIDTLNSETDFGDSLEAVEGFISQLESSHSGYRKTSEEKLKVLQDLWKEMQSMGITELKYTVLTIKDLEARNGNLEEALKNHLKAYEAERERQRMLEAKRKEFAKMAQKFVETLNERKTQIQSLTGEPDALIQEIQENFKEGQPERAQLKEIQAFVDEMTQLGINENRHTDLNIQILTSRTDALANFVKNFISSLKEEKQNKAQYLAQAQELLDWISQTIPNLKQRNFDNTLEGAQNQKREFDAFRTGQRAQNLAKLNALEKLFHSVQALLKKNNRPAFQPSQGFSVEEIKSQWSLVLNEEKAKEEALNKEIERQEKIAQLIKRFHNESQDLEDWIQRQVSYLNQRETVNSLDEAQFSLSTFDVYSDAAKERKQRLNQLGQLKDEIVGLKAKDAEKISQKSGEIEKAFEALSPLAKEKSDYLQAQLQREQKIDQLRNELQVLVKEFEGEFKEAEEALTDFNFGFEISKVQAYKEDLGKTFEKFREISNSRLSAARKIHSELSEEFKQTEKNNANGQNSLKKVEEISAEIQKLLQARNEAYEAELDKQLKFEERRKAFAKSAQEFVDFIGKTRQEVDLINQNSQFSLAEKREKISAVSSGNSQEISEKLKTLQSTSSQMTKDGIYGNKHTNHTVNSLQARVNQNTKFVENVLAQLAEEEALQERIKQQEKELAAKEAIENLVIEFSKKATALNQFIESAEDFITEPFLISSVEEANQLVQNYNQFVSSKQEPQVAKVDELKAHVENMKSQGVTDFSGIQPEDLFQNWQKLLTSSAQRKKELEAELEKQKKNDQICQQFAQKAGDFRKFLNEKKDLSGNLKGDLKQQLEQLRSILSQLESSSKEQFPALNTIERQITEAGIKVNKYTDVTVKVLTLEFQQLTTALTKQEKVLTGEIFFKNNANVTPEQLQEFKEVFQVFDKNQNGFLGRLEFKACLTALSETPQDAELDEILKKIDPAGKGVTFEAFTTFMSNKLKDSDTSDEIMESFKAVANDKDFVTEDDLRRAMDSDRVGYLVSVMPKYEGVPNGYDYKAWVKTAFK